MMAIPSRARVVPTRPWASSSASRAREARPMSALPFRAPSTPAPEPPPSTLTVTPSLSRPNCSARVFMTSSIEVEPTHSTVPDSSASGSAVLGVWVLGVWLCWPPLPPQAARETAMARAIIIAMIFFILSSLHFLVRLILSETMYPPRRRTI